METLAYIMDKFKPEGDPPYKLNIGRFKDMPRLFNELGFSKGAEIGVYRAHYSRWLFRYIKDLHLIGVDLWEAYPGFKDFKKNDLKEAKVEAREFFAKKNGYLIQDWSDIAVKEIADGSLDFVFIDGNHAFEYVVRDIALWSEKVRKGGIVFGHDYDDYTNSRHWKEMGVIPAVDGWVKARKISPLFITTKNKNKCWFYVKD